jgi:opacity protein-like surface antigen
MRLKPNLGLSLALLFACSAYHAVAQTAPAAKEAKLPLAIGAGFSGYNPDEGHTHLLGSTVWIDYFPSQMPEFLRGIGIEAEARDLNYDRSSAASPNLREDVAGGGVIYSWPRYRNFRPYGKFFMAYGNTDYEGLNQKRHNDSRTVTSVGGGVEYRAFRSVWVRADYEYQWWPDFFKHAGNTLPAGLLNPQGFTVGALYHFNRPHFR